MKLLTEKEAEDLLEKEGFNIVKRQFVKSKKEVKNLMLRYPLAAKISSRHIMHKAKIGGTILNIRNEKEAEKAVEKLCKIKDCEGILFQEMVYGQEIILGLKSTPEFGLVILVGEGGIGVEKKKDISFRILPIKDKNAEEMLAELKIKVKNKKAVIKNLIKLAKLAEKYNIEELDINPLILANNKAIVVDARIVLKVN